jgi:AcrR family transcriptional regulator
VDPEDYFHAALDILTDFGPESLTAARLCERLNVTKGSFYHHFQGMDDFVESLAVWSPPLPRSRTPSHV